MNNRVVHFEIPCNDPQKTMDFFSQVFGWTFQQFGTEEYWLAITGNEKDHGINGGIMKKRDPQQPLANSVNSEDIDGDMKKIELAGGKIVVPKMAIPGVGWLAYFTDPDGNIHSLHQADAKAQ